VLSIQLYIYFTEVKIMIYYPFVFFIMTVTTSLFGFRRLESGISETAKIFFYIFEFNRALLSASILFKGYHYAIFILWNYINSCWHYFISGRYISERIILK
jgi:uncharacterized membrane protein YtjA (UPF0391 family)